MRERIKSANEGTPLTTLFVHEVRGNGIFYFTNGHAGFTYNRDPLSTHTLGCVCTYV